MTGTDPFLLISFLCAVPASCHGQSTGTEGGLEHCHLPHTPNPWWFAECTRRVRTFEMSFLVPLRVFLIAVFLLHCLCLITSQPEDLQSSLVPVTYTGPSRPAYLSVGWAGGTVRAMHCRSGCFGFQSCLSLSGYVDCESFGLVL